MQLSPPNPRLQVTGCLRRRNSIIPTPGKERGAVDAAEPRPQIVSPGGTSDPDDLDQTCPIGDEANAPVQQFLGDERLFEEDLLDLASDVVP